MPPNEHRRRGGGQRGANSARRAARSLAPILLGVCVVLSPQLLGGAYGWGIATIAALAGLACVAAVWKLRSVGTAVDVPGALVLAALAWTALQALPLPRAITAWLQPDALDFADSAAALVSDPAPSWVPLTLSPGSTRAEIVKGTAIAAAFFAAWLVSRAGQRRRVAQFVALSALVMALVALAHLAAGAERLFGVYQRVDTASPLPAPLLNQNHLAGFLGMGVPVAIGLALDEEDRGKRIAYLTGAAVIGACVLLAVSRGGVAGLVCGVLALGALGLARRRRGGARDLGATYATIGAAVSAMAGLGLYVGAQALYRDFEHGDASKLELGARGLALALDHPWVGIGRGAFSAAFVGQHGTDVRFTHPENLPAQWASEWGLAPAAVLAGALAWGIVRATATARSWTSLGAAAGLVAIVVHDLVDFALEMAGVAVVAAALLAAVVAPRRSAARTERGVRARHAGALAATLALIATALLGPRLDAESTHALTAQLVRLAKSGDRESFEATLRQALRLHPAEPVFPLLAGAAAVRDDDDRALRWLNRAMVLAPGWASPHVETARLLAQRGRLTQAFLELREAETRHAGSGTALACTILEQRPHAAPELVRIAGAGPFADDLLDRIARCLPLEHEASTIVDAHLVERGSIGARTRNASRLLAAGDARAALEALESLRTPDTDAQLVRASALLALGEHREALHVLDRAEALADRPEEVLALRARVQAAAGDVEGMRTTMRRIRGRAGGRARALAAAWITEGGLEQSLGNTGAALSAYQRAHRLDPDSAGLARSAALAESTGDLSRALRAYAELCLRDGRESPHCAARDRVERRLAELPRLPAQPPGTP